MGSYGTLNIFWTITTTTNYLAIISTGVLAIFTLGIISTGVLDIFTLLKFKEINGHAGVPVFGYNLAFEYSGTRAL
jgi:hypothetical protein